MNEQPLAGGVANPGAVVRVGDTVRRPASPESGSIHRFLEHLAAAGFEAPRPSGFDEQGREILSFIPGDVPVPPYPSWALTDDALAGIGRLLRRLHDAAASFEFDNPDEWSDELRDPVGAEIICHNDVCLENVVFRDGEPRAFLDFDYAAPGRRLWDLAMTASLCAPMHPEGFEERAVDPGERLAVLAHAYGVLPDQSEELVDAIFDTKRVGFAFVQRHVDAGHPGFVEMVAGWAPDATQRRLEWLLEMRDAFVATLQRKLAQ